MKKIILAAVLFLTSVSPVLAHPGRTSSDGCHYCRTNCDSWGVAWNERHCHGGSSYLAPVVTKAPTVAPTQIYTPTPTKVATPTPSRVVTPSPTKEPTPTPTQEITPSATPTEEITVTPTKTVTSTPTPIPTVKAARTSQSGGFWNWLRRLFGGK